MQIFKQILRWLTALAILCYLLFAPKLFASREKIRLCENLQIIVHDSLKYNFISSAGVRKILKQNDISPVGKPLHQINIAQLELLLQEHTAIDQAQCYYTPGGSLVLEIFQREPFFRVMGAHNFFVDKDGKKMPPFNGQSTSLPIVTGAVEKIPLDTLCQFVKFTQKKRFWASQIQQIHVRPSGEIELAVRVGSHSILLGDLKNYEQKLYKMHRLYRKGLDKMDWEQYRKFDLRYKNQIIGIK